MVRVDEIGIPLGEIVDYLGNPLFGKVDAGGRFVIPISLVNLFESILCGVVFNKIVHDLTKSESIILSQISSKIIYEDMFEDGRVLFGKVTEAGGWLYEVISDVGRKQIVRPDPAGLDIHVEVVKTDGISLATTFTGTPLTRLFESLVVNTGISHALSIVKTEMIKLAQVSNKVIYEDILEDGRVLFEDILSDSGDWLYEVITDRGSRRVVRMNPDGVDIQVRTNKLELIEFNDEKYYSIMKVMTDILYTRKAIVYNATFIPEMTSNTTPSGYIASANNVYNATYAAWHAFDRAIINDNAWMTASGVVTGWLAIQHPVAKIVRKYTIYDRRYDINQDAGGAAFAPYKWDFQGSNNGIDWVTIDSQDEVTWIISAQEAKTYEFPNTVAYLYHRINVLENNGGGRVAIGEFILYDEEVNAPLNISAIANYYQPITIGGEIHRTASRACAECLNIIGSTPKEVSRIFNEVFSLLDPKVVFGITFIYLEKLIVYQIPYVESVRDYIEDGSVAFNSAITDAGDVIYNNITLAGKEFLSIHTWEHRLGVTIVSNRQIETINPVGGIRLNASYTISNVIQIIGHLPIGLEYFLVDNIQVSGTYLSRATKRMATELIGIPESITHNPLMYRNERINLIGTKKPYPTHKMPESIYILETRKVLAQPRLNDLITLAGTSYKSLIASFLEVIKLSKFRSTTVYTSMIPESINFVDEMTYRVTNWLIETLNVSGWMGQNQVVVLKPDIVRLAKDFPPLDPFHMGRIPVIIAYNSLPSQVIAFSDGMIKQLHLVMALETIELTIESFTKSFSRVLTDLVVMRDHEIAKLQVLVTRVISELFNVGDSLVKWPSKVFLEVLLAEQGLSTTVLTHLSETIKLFQSVIKRPMKYQTPESIIVSDTRSVSVLSAMITEVLAVDDTIRRLVSVPLIEKVKLTDVQCAKIVSFVTHEILALVGSEHATLSRTLSEILLLPDSKHIGVLVERLEALLVSTRIARVVRYSAFTEIISITQSTIPRVFKILNESIYMEMSLNKSVRQVKIELITIGQRFNKIIHAHVLDLETISLSDTRDWYNNLVHRIESVIKQTTKIRSSERTDKEKVIKKITKDSKRE